MRSGRKGNCLSALARVLALQRSEALQGQKRFMSANEGTFQSSQYFCNLSAAVPYIVKGISQQVSLIFNPEAKRRGHLLSSYNKISHLHYYNNSGAKENLIRIILPFLSGRRSHG